MSDHEDGGDDGGVVESPDVHVTPIVKLKLVEVATGEDEEETIFETFVATCLIDMPVSALVTRPGEPSCSSGVRAMLDLSGRSAVSAMSSC